MTKQQEDLEGAPRVMAAARRVLAKHGPDALTMRNVADEAGVTATAIYRHFSDKDAFLKELIRTEYDRFLGYIGRAVEGTRPLDQLLGAFDGYLAFALDHPHAYELLFVTPHRLSIDRYPADFTSGKSRGFRQLKALVEAAIASGDVRAGDATDLALDFYAHAHGLVMLHRAGRFGDKNEVMRRFFRRSLARLV